MPDSLIASGSKCPALTISQDDSSELELIRDDIISDALFLVGTFISMNANFESEQEIVCPEEIQISGLSAAAEETTRSEQIIVVNLLFLAGTIIIAYTGYVRLSKLKAESSNDTDNSVLNNIRGSELVVLGLLIRIVGYIVSYVGNRIKADNPV